VGRYQGRNSRSGEKRELHVESRKEYQMSE
jgi:hypothetical protein